MLEMERKHVILLSIVCLALSIGISYCMTIDWDYYWRNDLSEFRTKEKQNLYTRGQMHYLSMDEKMGSCWNDTVKKLIYLSCPYVGHDDNVEMELIFMLTSCFCESVGPGRLTCLIKKSKNKEADKPYKYAQTLAKCATNKCYTEFGRDAYGTISTRMPELCYYMNEEVKKGKLESVKCPDEQLRLLRKTVNGDRADELYPRLKYIDSIVYNELVARESTVAKWFERLEERFWSILDGLQFLMRIGKYRNVPQY